MSILRHPLRRSISRQLNQSVQIFPAVPGGTPQQTTEQGTQEPATTSGAIQAGHDMLMTSCSLFCALTLFISSQMLCHDVLVQISSCGIIWLEIGASAMSTAVAGLKNKPSNTAGGSMMLVQKVITQMSWCKKLPPSVWETVCSTTCVIAALWLLVVA